MDTQDIKSIETRLHKLEKQNRIWKVCSVTALVLIGSLLLMGQASPNPKSIVAEQLTLIREDGKTFAAFASGPDGTSGLWLYDKDGKPRSGFSVSKDGSPALELFDIEGKC